MTASGLVDRLIRRAEGLPGGGLRLASLFAATVITRNVLEGLSGGCLFPIEAFVFHFPMAYVYPMLGIVAAMHALSGYPAARLMKLMIYAWTLTLLPPVLDILLGSGSGIGYFPLDRSNALHFLAGFFDPSVELPGTTAGIRIEAALGCILGGAFIGAVSGSRRLLRGIAGALLLAPLFLVFFGWPGLLNWAFGGVFPATSGIQDFLQWHSATRPHLTGSVHMTVFLVDAWPVTFLAAWLLTRSGSIRTGDVRRAILDASGTLAATLAGTAAALAAVAGNGSTVFTFADAASVSGAFLSAALIAVLSRSRGRSGVPGAVFALAVAAAVGWPTLVAAMLALSFTRLPAGSRIRDALAGPVLALTAASPIFPPVEAVPVLWPLLIPAALVPLLAGSDRRLIPLSLLIPAAAMALGAEPPRPAQLGWLEETTDSFTRSTRNPFAAVSSAQLAGSGGSIVPLAQSAQLSGRIDQAEWLWNLSRITGESSDEMSRVGIHLALLAGDLELFSDLAGSSTLSEEELGRLYPAVLGSAAAAGDTLFLGRVFESSGSSAVFLNSWARALLVLGDTAGAENFSIAATHAPDAGPSDYALAAELSALAGSDACDSILDRAAGLFRGSPQLDLARLRVSMITGRIGSGRASVTRLLGSNPASPGDLEACAAWLLQAGEADSALHVAERSLMMQYPPGRSTLALAVACAEASGDTARADVHMGYFRSVYLDGDLPIRDPGPER